MARRARVSAPGRPPMPAESDLTRLGLVRGLRQPYVGLRTPWATSSEWTIESNRTAVPLAVGYAVKYPVRRERPAVVLRR